MRLALENRLINITTKVIYAPLTTFWTIAQKLYWGKFYFKGWIIEVCVNGMTARSKPAAKGPTPEDVAKVTAGLIKDAWGMEVK